MRHLEAFAQTTQPAEPGKGKSWQTLSDVLLVVLILSRPRHRQRDQGIIPGSLWFVEAHGISHTRVWNHDRARSRSSKYRVLLQTRGRFRGEGISDGH